jgi:fatty acid kinase
VLGSTIERVAQGCEVLTVVAGDGAPLSEDQLAELVPDGVELDFHDGGQPAWWYLLAAE